MKERYAKEDFIENHNVCLIGSPSVKILKFINEVDGTFFDEFLFINTAKAEIKKYYNNIFEAPLVKLANNFYELYNLLILTIIS